MISKDDWMTNEELVNRPAKTPREELLQDRLKSALDNIDHLRNFVDEEEW